MLPPEPCHWTCPFVVLCLGAHVFLQIKSSDSMIICAGEKVCLLSVSPEEQAHCNPKDRPWLPEDLKQAKRYSRRFQWLPCNVSLNETCGCRITSYTNNLPPLGQPTAVWRHQGNYHSAYTTMRLDIKFCSKEIVASSLQSCRIPWGSLRCGFITRRSLYSNAAKNPRIWSPKCDGRNDQSNKQLSERGLQYDSKNVTGNNIVFRQRSDTADIQATDYPEYHDEWVEPIYGLSEPRERKLVT